MTTDKDIHAELVERRDEVFAKLRDREPDLVARWVQLNAAIAGIEAESTRVVRKDEYSGFRKPSEALFAYLDRIARPQAREEIAQALVDGGYGRGTKKPYWILVRTVEYQLEKEGAELKEINGLVGRIEWPKDLFVGE